MGAGYTALDYLGLPLAILLCGLLLLPALGIFLSFKLVRKYKKVGIGYYPVIVMVPLMVLLVMWGGPVFTQVGDLMLPNESVIITTAGEIETIEPAAMGSWHYIDGKIVTGQMVFLNDQRYYVISDNLLEEGLVISLTYSHSGNGNVILSWWEITKEEADRIYAEAPQPEMPEKPVKAVPESQRILAVWLLRIGFAGFVITERLLTKFHGKIVEYLLNEEPKVRGDIRFNFKSLPVTLGPLCWMFVLMAGVVLSTAERAVITVPILGGGGMLAWLAVEATSWLRLDGQTLTVHRIWKEKQYQLSDVRGVFWRQHRGIVAKSLVLVMNDGKIYWFNMDFFSGTPYVYRVLSENLK